MDEQKHILSYGAGVNSTAILALIKMGKLSYSNMRIVFADPGCEKPATYCYINNIRKEFNIEIVRSELGNLYDFCLDHKCVPHQMFRWCTEKFKIRPIQKWEKQNDLDRKEVIAIIGFCKGEEKRADNSRNRTGNEIYPLIELGLTRDDCKDIIRQVGWEVPPKSGCFICPFQRKLEWISMMKNDPELWKKVMDLEKNSNTTYRTDRRTIEEWLKDEKSQERLQDFEEYQHCICHID